MIVEHARLNVPGQNAARATRRQRMLTVDAYLRALEETQRSRQSALAPHTKADLAALEEAFVTVAAVFADERGVEYESWREFGVAPNVLRRAAIRP
jgi:hypothetical protein